MHLIVLLCNHVQSYELIKTEDIPNLENSGFSPRVVKDVAQNILSFLKANATKEGHTYWLFRGWIFVCGKRHCYLSAVLDMLTCMPLVTPAMTRNGLGVCID